MSTLIEVYFLECYSEKIKSEMSQSNSANNYLIGPYSSEEQARRRGAVLVQQVEQQGTTVKIRRMNASRVGSDRIVIEGTRVFRLSAMIEVFDDGSVHDDSNELRLPSDYFESSEEFV